MDLTPETSPLAEASPLLKKSLKESELKEKVTYIKQALSNIKSEINAEISTSSFPPPASLSFSRRPPPSAPAFDDYLLAHPMNNAAASSAAILRAIPLRHCTLQSAADSSSRNRASSYTGGDTRSTMDQPESGPSFADLNISHIEAKGALGGGSFAFATPVPLDSVQSRNSSFQGPGQRLLKMHPASRVPSSLSHSADARTSYGLPPGPAYKPIAHAQRTHEGTRLSNDRSFGETLGDAPFEFGSSFAVPDASELHTIEHKELPPHLQRRKNDEMREVRQVYEPVVAARRFAAKPPLVRESPARDEVRGGISGGHSAHFGFAGKEPPRLTLPTSTASERENERTEHNYLSREEYSFRPPPKEVSAVDTSMEYTTAGLHNPRLESSMDVARADSALGRGPRTASRIGGMALQTLDHSGFSSKPVQLSSLTNSSSPYSPPQRVYS